MHVNTALVLAEGSGWELGQLDWYAEVSSDFSASISKSSCI